MSVRAQTSDGVIHEFPDGTSRDVINRAMKDYTLKYSGGGGGNDNDNDDGSSKFAAQQDAEKIASMGSGSNREMLQGMTFGFGDELTAAGGAALTGASNLIDRARGKTPKYGAGEFYDATLRAERSAQEKYEQEHPVGSFAEQALGTAMNPLGQKAGKFIEAGPTAVARAARTAGTAGGMGALTGYGSGQGQHGTFLGDSWDRLKDAAWTGGLSVPLSLAFPAIGSGSRAASRVGRALWDKFTELTGKSPKDAAKVMSPQMMQHYKDIAAETVEGLIKSAGKTVESLKEDPAHKMGKPITTAEAIGSVGESHQASLARRTGTTGDLAESTFRQRGQERPERLKEDLAKAASLLPEKIEYTMSELSDDLRTKNVPLYEKAYTHPDVDIDKDPRLKSIINRLPKGAIEDAKELARKEGRAFTYNASSKVLSWENLDFLKRAAAASIGRTHKDVMGRTISDDFSRADFKTIADLREHLFKLNPDYKAAVDKGGDVIRLEQAYMKAPELMSGKVSEYQFDKRINEMSPAELEALKHGWVKDTFDKIQNGKLRTNDFANGNFMAKAKRLLGESKAREFVSRAEQEARMKGAESSIPPRKGSATMKLTSSKEEIDHEVDEKMHSFIDNAIRRGKDVAIMRTLNDIYWSTVHAAKTADQEQIRNEVGKLLDMRVDEAQAELAKPRGSKIHNASARDIGRAILSVSAVPVTTQAAKNLGESQ